jgi:hypothetical protein
LTKHKKNRQNKTKKNNWKKAETQGQIKLTIINFLITQVADMAFFIMSHEMIFYNFPWFWKDEKIHNVLKMVGHIERMSIKWNFKYKTVACFIRLTKGYKSTLKNGA